MSFVTKLIISGWVSTFAMIGICALNESGKLLRIHQCIGRWLETLAPQGIGSSVEKSERGGGIAA